MTQKYILIKGIVNPDNSNELIPCWDRRIEFKKGRFGPEIIFDRQRVNLVDLILDLETKNISRGIELYLYPDKEDFVVGEIVFVEKSFRTVSQSTIKEIIYSEYEETISLGKNIDSYMLSSINMTYPDIKIDVNQLYCIRCWKTYYLLENNDLIKYSSALLKLIK